MQLRDLGIVSSLFFVAYGALAGAIPTFLMYLLLLPVNSLRLVQMRSLVKKARIAHKAICQWTGSRRLCIGATIAKAISSSGKDNQPTR